MIKVFSGRAHPGLAEAICRHLGITLGAADILKFNNDNTFVQIRESVRETDAFVVQPGCAPVNDGFMELAIMLDALRRASVRRLTAVLPYFPYSRSDKKDQPRVPITARLVADILEVAGASRVLTLDLHAAQIQGFFSVPVDHLTAIPLLAEYFQKKGLTDLVVVAPDVGRAKVAGLYAQRLRAPMAIIDKRRLGNTDEVAMGQIVGDVQGCEALLVDDEVSSGRSLVAAAETLAAHGARRVFAAVVHGVLAEGAGHRIQASPITELVVSDSVPVPPSKLLPKITVLSVAPLFAEAIHRIHTGDSVSTLFDTYTNSPR